MSKFGNNVMLRRHGWLMLVMVACGGARREGNSVLQVWELHPAADGKPALGVPAPSTSDVQLFKRLVEDLGLREVWVTNGMYTGIVHSENLGQFNTRE